MINKEAAKGTAMIVAALTMSAVGAVAMITVAPEFTVGCLLVAALFFSIKGIYEIEKGRIEAVERLNDLNKKFKSEA